MKNTKTQRLSIIRLLILAVAITALAKATGASAATIFESGTLGPTGIPQGSVAATNITRNVFVGVRFQLTQPALTTKIGGHFVDHLNGTFFGAIVDLEDGTDFPDSGDLSTPDVLGTAKLTFPVPSAEVVGDLSLSLAPGWYALVFGSGLFGTLGDGAAPRNGSDINDPAYIGFQPGSAFGWVNITTFTDHRFVLKGRIVPEASSFALWSITSLLLFFRKKSREIAYSIK